MSPGFGITILSCRAILCKTGIVRIHYIQHEKFETPGSILDWAERQGHPVTRTLIYLQDAGKVQGNGEAALPAMKDFDWLVIMGGSMNVYEEDKYHWLTVEKRFIAEAVRAGKTVLGLCLGAQLLAAVLGGRVTRNQYREIGWHPVRLTGAARENPCLSFLPEEPVVFQWHGDTFSELPPGALLLAESEACAHQAFVYGERVFAFQFHMENTGSILRGLVENCAGELTPETYVQNPAELLAHPECIGACEKWMDEFLTRLAAL
ncbi:MAG: type 1 glutamine amidotransferase [Treponema sp.]|nr:type 1 glutamine amidotransferase [Treponema sp.]